MIGRLRGKLVSCDAEVVLVDVGGVGYEVLVPPTLAQYLRTLEPGSELELVTHYYLQLTPSIAHPTLIGFRSELEREFFELFITVASIGPKTAVKAFTIPFATVARAIELGDSIQLRALPGIGREKAKQIIAKLQGKAARFLDIRDEDLPRVAPRIADIEDEVEQALRQLGYGQAEIAQMIARALRDKPELDTTEALLAAALARPGE
jgi:Holliday junction DNA helicase RuvA